MSENKKPKKGRVIRLSPEVELFLRKHRKKSESFDATLRRRFGLPTRKGEPQELGIFFVLENSGRPLIFTEEPEARGFAVELAIRKRTRKAERVLTVQEIPWEQGK